MPSKKSKPALRHLTLTGRQYQFRKRLSRELAAQLGKQFFSKNLGTDKLSEAQRLRDRFLVEIAELERKAKTQAPVTHSEELEIFESLMADPDPENRAAVESHYHEQAEEIERISEGEGVAWYQRITGQSTPIEFHLDRFFADHPIKEIKQRQRAIKQFSDWARKHLQQVDRKLAGEYVSHLVEQGYAAQTVNGHISHISSYWKWLLKRGLTKDNPWREQQVKKVKRIKRIAWPIADVPMLIERAPSPSMAEAILIATLSGMRVSELCRLKVGDVKENFFHVTDSKTEAGIRRVPVHSMLSELVDSKTTGREPNEWLLPVFSGNGKNLVKRFVRYRDKLLGKDTSQPQNTLTFHSLRHTFVTEAIRNRCDLVALKEVTGHSAGDITTGVYHHGCTDDQLKDAVELVKLPLEDSGNRPVSSSTPVKKQTVADRQNEE